MNEIKSEKERLLFCNIAYMQEYDRVRDSKPPQGGGAYVAEHKTGGEIDNFRLCADGNYYGYVEAGLTDDRHDTIHIENIDGQYKGGGNDSPCDRCILCAAAGQKRIGHRGVV